MADQTPLDDIITDTDLDNYTGARRVLADGLRAAVAAGHPASQIAKRLSGVFGNNAVTDYVAALRTAESANHALAAAHLDTVARAAANGLKGEGVAYSAAYVYLTADPSQTDAEYYAKLPDFIRRALAPALLVVHEASDEALLAGERAMLMKLRPQY